MNKTDNTIFIVIPVYNSERFLHRCINSILNQTYTNFVLVLVDDGSSDHSLEIIRDYEVKDSRIIAIHQENAGVSAARNTGIEYVLSIASIDNDYLCFVDSDDWVHCKYLEYLVKGMKDNRGNMVACARHNTSENFIEDAPLKYKIETYSPEQYWLKNKSCANFVWGKLYKIHCWESIRFSVGRTYEDMAIAFKIIFAQTMITFIPVPLYYYYSNNSSITRSTWTMKRLDKIWAYEEQLQYFKNYNLDLSYQHSLFCICEELIKTIRYIEVQMPENKQLMSDVKRKTKKYMSLYAKTFGKKRAFELWVKVRYTKRIRKAFERKLNVLKKSNERK